MASNVRQDGVSSRRRARPSDGERTTLRIPARLESALSRLMGERGLTRNEALIALAERGATALEAEHRATVARRTIEEAVLGSHAPGPLPSAAEVEAAMIAARGGRD